MGCTPTTVQTLLHLHWFSSFLRPAQAAQMAPQTIVITRIGQFHAAAPVMLQPAKLLEECTPITVQTLLHLLHRFSSFLRPATEQAAQMAPQTIVITRAGQFHAAVPVMLQPVKLRGGCILTIARVLHLDF